MKHLDFTIASCLVLAGAARGAPQSEVQVEALLTENGGAIEHRGESVFMLGNTLFVASPSDVVGGTDRILVYEIPPAAATMPQPIDLPTTNLPANGRFGSAMTARSDFFFASVSRAGAGEVRVYERIAPGPLGSWGEFSTLTPAVGGAGDTFGRSLAVAGDTLVVGAHRDDDLGQDSGSATVFAYDGMNWTLQEVLLASGGAALYRFGTSVAADGTTIFVGSPNENVAGSRSGAVYVFRSALGGWMETQKLSPSDAQADQRFGARIIHDSGRLFVGAPTDDQGGSATGAIYVYQELGSTWTEMDKIVPPGVGLFELFGQRFDVEGSKLVAGIPIATLGAQLTSKGLAGKLLVLELNQGTWSEVIQLRMANPTVRAQLGFSVSVGSGPWIAAGAPGDLQDGFAEAVVFDLNQDETVFCFGTGTLNGACANCPCGNQSYAFAGSSSVAGCRNSSVRGAQLVSAGAASVLDDTLEVRLRYAPTNSFALLFSGSSGLPMGGTCTTTGGGVTSGNLDGLRCVGVDLLRHGVRATDVNGVAQVPWGGAGGPVQGILAASSFTAGQTRYFQSFMRENAAVLCGTGVATSNAMRVEIRP